MHRNNTPVVHVASRYRAVAHHISAPKIIIMPLFPSLNDLKGMTISINPLNLFDAKPPTAANGEIPASPSSPTTPRVGEAGPGPSSMSNRANATGSPSPLGTGVGANGTEPRRPVVKQSSSDSSSGASGRPRLEARRPSSQLQILSGDTRRREKKKKVPMDVSQSTDLADISPMSLSNPLRHLPRTL